MASTFSGLEIGRSGLTAAQVGLHVTGQNISNASTPGYSRQRVKTAPIEPVGRGYLLRQITQATNIGQGVTVLSIEQLRSDYLDEQYRGQYSSFNNSEFRLQGLTYLENLFNETKEDTSLTTTIASFFTALSKFSENTTSEAARTTVQQTALSLTESFNMTFGEMVDLYNDQNSSIKTVATQVNLLAEQIAGLNETIAEYEHTNVKANELRDMRNVLLDKLSGYTGVSYTEDEFGMVNVTLGGETLVDGINAERIGVSTASEQMNTICTRLATLNTEISGSATAEQTEERDALLANLSKLSTKVLYTVDSIDGKTTVTLQGVTDPLVETDGTLRTATSDQLAEFEGAREENTLKLGNSYLTTDNVKSGELSAHLFLRDGGSEQQSGIPFYVGKLNELARTITQSVNEVMNKGWTYPHGTEASKTGVDMFEDFGDDFDLITAGNFTLSKDVLESVWNIAGSSEKIDLDTTTGSTNAANNEIALELSRLINTGAYGDKLDSLVSHLGLDVSSLRNELDVRHTLVESIDNQRQSISGVSIDEEAVNLIKYQQIYSACSRVITAIDQQLDKLINSTGRVGL